MSELKAFVKNAADPEQVKGAKQKEKFAKINETNDLLWVLSDPRGRRFVWGLLSPTNEISFVTGMPDLTAFKEGCRNKANQLLSKVMDAKPEAYILMLNESKLRDINQEEPKEQENGTDTRE
jgi:hypothetical protein